MALSALGRDFPPHLARTRALLLPLVALVAGCAQLLGIDDWEAGGNEPGSTAASSASASTSSSGGAGGVGGSGGETFENATCADGIKNGLETDTDCGGDSCWPCPLNGICSNDADCETGSCKGKVCAPAPIGKQCPLQPDPDNPTCADCVMNGQETDVDCGGDSCSPCPTGATCMCNSDCKSGLCDGDACAAFAPKTCPTVDPDNPTCADCVKNGSETDVDCGGDACGPCDQGKLCIVSTDCKTNHCNGTTCDVLAPQCPPGPDPLNATCADCVKNGPETDVDCGGDACAPCSAGKKCNWDNDCLGNVCQGGICS